MCTQFASAAKASGKRVFTPGNVGACIDKTTIGLRQDGGDHAHGAWRTCYDACNYVFQGNGETLTDAVRRSNTTARARSICDKGFCATTMTKGSRRSRAAIRATVCADRELLHDEQAPACWSARPR